MAESLTALLGAIDIFYVARRRISPVYLLDALVQLGLVALWMRSPTDQIS